MVGYVYKRYTNVKLKNGTLFFHDCFYLMSFQLHR